MSFEMYHICYIVAKCISKEPKSSLTENGARAENGKSGEKEYGGKEREGERESRLREDYREIR